MVIGVWVIVLPFLGFPESWKSILAVATGLLIVWVAYRLASDPSQKTGAASQASFVEHRSADPTKAVAPAQAPAKHPTMPSDPVTNPDNAPVA